MSANTIEIYEPGVLQGYANAEVVEYAAFATSPRRRQTPGKSRPQGALVYLNVYHLTDNWEKSNTLSSNLLGFGGAFHAGIEVHGVEWTYGVDGISCNEPRTHQVHIYHESILMGETDLSADDVVRMIEQRKMQWLGEDYHLLDNNCCSFSDVLSQDLVGEPIPDWVVRFPRIASAATARLDQVIDTKQLGEDLRPMLGELTPTTVGTITPMQLTPCGGVKCSPFGF